MLICLFRPFTAFLALTQNHFKLDIFDMSTSTQIAWIRAKTRLGLVVVEKEESNILQYYIITHTEAPISHVSYVPEALGLGQ